MKKWESWHDLWEPKIDHAHDMINEDLKKRIENLEQDIDRERNEKEKRIKERDELKKISWIWNRPSTT